MAAQTSSTQAVNDQLLQRLPTKVKEQPQLHRGLPFLASIYDEHIEELVKAGNSPLNREPSFQTRVYGELAEHDHLGNSIYLQDPKDKNNNVKAANLKLRLQNGLELTYGQINWLAGDFYGTNNPISDGVDQDQRIEYFKQAFAYLAERREAEHEAKAIPKQGQVEIDLVNKAISSKDDPSTAYPSIEKLVPWDVWKSLTDNRPDGMGYIGLAQKDFDHFGEDAQKAYNAGHAYALSVAASGDLNKAYAVNAFADHFLEDRFSAGHLRTPRRFGHLSVKNGFGALNTGSACAKLTHDEDSAIGLMVANTKGESWKCYGDKRMLDTEDAENKHRCILALMQNTKEVTEAFNKPEAYHGGKIPVGLVWDIAPTLDSARDQSKQELSPLFTPDGKVRDDVKDRRDPSHSEMSWKWFGNWFGWFGEIARECEFSGRWKYPIHMQLRASIGLACCACLSRSLTGLPQQG